MKTLIALAAAALLLLSVPGCKQTWNSTNRAAFMQSCEAEAKKSVTPAKATEYCACALSVTEKKYPDPANAEPVPGRLMPITSVRHAMVLAV